MPQSFEDVHLRMEAIADIRSYRFTSVLQQLFAEIFGGADISDHDLQLHSGLRKITREPLKKTRIIEGRRKKQGAAPLPGALIGKLRYQAGIAETKADIRVQ